MNENKNNAADRNSLLKAYTTTELAALYGVSYRVFMSWLKPFKSRLGKRIGHYYTPLQVEAIFLFLGPPDADDQSPQHKSHEG